MSLTITVTLDDEDVGRFVDLYNEHATDEITVDMVNQNSELPESIADDMKYFWFEAIEDAENYGNSTNELYSSCFGVVEEACDPLEDVDFDLL